MVERARREGIEFRTEAFQDFLITNRPDPRGVPPIVVEAEIAYPGTTGVRVALNEKGDVITVMIGVKK